MAWIYSIFIWLFMSLTFATSGETKMLFLGIEIGVCIGQVIFVINEMRMPKE